MILLRRVVRTINVKFSKLALLLILFFIGLSYQYSKSDESIDINKINKIDPQVTREADRLINQLKQEQEISKKETGTSVQDITNQSQSQTSLSLQQADLKELLQGPSCQEKTCHSRKINIPLSQAENLKSQVLIFISLSMPEASLKAYSQTTLKIGARLILQGLHQNSFQATQKKIMDLGINVDIDPPLFEQYQIKEVPTFIHAQIESNEYSVDKFDIVKGNITLEAALDIFKQRGTIKGASDLLKRLRS